MLRFDDIYRHALIALSPCPLRMVLPAAVAALRYCFHADTPFLLMALRLFRHVMPPVAIVICFAAHAAMSRCRR